MTELSEIRPVNQCIVLDLQKGVRGPDIQLSSESAKKQLYDRLFQCVYSILAWLGLLLTRCFSLVNLYNHSKTHR